MQIKNLEYYEHSNIHYDDYIDLIQQETSGGKISIEQIDTIAEFPAKKALIISGLRQDTFEYLIEHYGHQFDAIYFWKCQNIADLSKLETLANIKYILFFRNIKTKRLWDLSKNKKLKGLLFTDFTQMQTLEDIPKSTSLEELNFGNAWLSESYICDSLAPLADSSTLKNLTFTMKKLLDNDHKPLTQIKNLQQLKFPASLFTTEQVAYLTAKLPQIKYDFLAPYAQLEGEFLGEKNCLIIGKGKPFLDPIKDAKRIEKYKQQFDEWVEKYKNE